MSTTIAIILVFVALFIGFLLGKQLSRSANQSEKVILEERQASYQREIEQYKAQMTELKRDFEAKMGQLSEERNALLQEKQLLMVNLSRKETELKNTEERSVEQKREIEELQAKFTKEFENLANKILEEKSLKFTEQNKENIKNILNPLQEKIQLFEKKVEDSQKENIGIHSSLREQLLHLQNQNLKITQEAENLTKALKGDSKIQGNWGELVLERVLEKSGLEKDREYFVQQSFTTEDGKRIMPDVVIHLPDNKKMIIDSKVSLTGYERYVNESDETLKTSYLKEHLNSIKRHIEQLSDKNYQDIYRIESPNFILLFIPIEPAFAVALNADNTLYNKAFEKNIIIVTPTTLLATLRTIDSMWTNQKQQENAFEIARIAGSLYEKFEGFVSDLIRIGKKMDEAKTEYSGAMNKLVDGRGNVITTIEKLKKMGAKTSKSLPESLIKRAEESNEM